MIVPERPALLRGRVTESHCQLLRAIQQVGPRLVIGWRKNSDRLRNTGKLLQHTVRFAAIRPAPYAPPWRVLAVRRVTDHRKADAVDGRHVTRNVQRHDRAVGGNTVKVRPRRVTAFCENGVVVTHADDPAAHARHFRAVEVRLERGHELVNRIDIPVRLRQQVGAHSLGTETSQVRVTIDEPRHHRAPCDVDNFGRGTLQARHVRIRTDGDDQTVGYRHGLHRWVSVIDRDDRTAVIDHIRERDFDRRLRRPHTGNATLFRSASG